MDRFKIVNKSKDGITIRFHQGKTLKMTWEEFNSNWIQVEDQMAEMKPEYKAELDQVNDKLDWLAVYVRRSQLIRLHISSGIATDKEKVELVTLVHSIGTLSNEISKPLGCTSVEVLQLVNQRLESLLEFSTPEFRKRYDKNYKTEPRLPQSSKPTLGDHPEFDKLKNLFKDD